MASHPDQELIRTRLAAYAAAWNKHSADDIVAFMTDGVFINDYCSFSHILSFPPCLSSSSPSLMHFQFTAAGVLNLSKAGVHTLYSNIFASSENLKVTTRSVSGHKHFTAWEWEVTFNYVKPMAHKEEYSPAMADGRSMCITGVSLLWWNDDGKIVKEHDYSKTFTQ